MLNETHDYFNELLRKNQSKPERIVEDLLNKFSDIDNPTADMTGIFSLCKKLGIRLVAIDYKDNVSQYIERGKGKKSYIFLNSTSNYRALRFDAATLLYCALHSKHDGKKVVTKHKYNNELHKAKKFAATLLMPLKKLKSVIYEKDDEGNYKYLVKVGNEFVIPFKNIHYIADRFGVEFATCAKRILHTEVVKIRRIQDMDELKKRLQGPQASEATRKELIPDWAKHDYKLKCCLINNMHFPNIDTANEVVKEKLRVESIKNDCVIEGVVSSTKGMDKFLSKYRANPEAMKEELYKLSVNQRIMLGHYDTIRRLEKIPFTRWIFNDLHKGIFEHAVFLPGEAEWLEDPKNFRKEVDVYLDFVPGAYRHSQNIINGASYKTDSPTAIWSVMDNLYYDMKDLLDNKDKYTNLEYINEVNYIADRFIVCHPFEDGNGRVSRLLMNYLLIHKGLPPFFINASKKKGEYIEILNELSDQTRYSFKDTIDFSKLNSLVIDGLIETEGVFFSAKAMIDDPEKTIEELKQKK